MFQLSDLHPNNLRPSFLLGYQLQIMPSNTHDLTLPIQKLETEHLLQLLSIHQYLHCRCISIHIEDRLLNRMRKSPLHDFARRVQLVRPRMRRKVLPAPHLRI